MLARFLQLGWGHCWDGGQEKKLEQFQILVLSVPPPLANGGYFLGHLPTPYLFESKQKQEPPPIQVYKKKSQSLYSIPVTSFKGTFKHKEWPAYSRDAHLNLSGVLA